MLKKVLVLVLGMVLLGFLVVASINLENANIRDTYEIGDNLEGSIVLSLNNENSDSKLVSKFDGEERGKMTLLNFLKLHKNLNYNCSPEDCEDNFQASGTGGDSKIFTLANDVSVGPKIEGAGVEITDLEFGVFSDTSDSCFNQLSIDVLGDGTIDWENKVALTNVDCQADKTSSCYGSGSFPLFAGIDQVPYCEKISLPKAPAYEIKSFMKVDPDTSFESDLLEGSLYYSDGELVGNCNFDKPSVGGSEESCIIESATKKSDNYFACVSLKEGSSISGYKISARSSGNKCGFRGDPSQPPGFVADYNIKVSSKKYAPVNSFTLNQTVFLEQNGNSLVAYVDNYINEKYGSNCPNNCIIPIVFSGQNQQVIVNNFLVKYGNAAFGSVENDKLYSVQRTPAKITSGNLTLDLSLGNLSVPTEENDYTLEVLIGDKLISSKDISVLEKAPPLIEQIDPKIIAAGTDTTFTAFIDSKVNLSEISFEWDFGDNSSKETTTQNKVNHVYREIGVFALKITSKIGSTELDTSEFNIIITSPKEAINSTLEEFDKRLNDVESQINSLPTAYQDIIINKGLDIAGLKSSLNDIRSTYNLLIKNNDTSDNSYIDVMLELNALDIPLSVKPSRTIDLPLAYDANDIVLQDIKDLFRESYQSSKEEDYRNGIVSWYLKNIDTIVNQKTYSINYDSYKEEFITEFKVQIIPKNSKYDKGYFIIEMDKDEIIFSGDYEVSSEAGVTGVELDLATKSAVNFAVEGDVEAFGITMYLSPELNSLGINREIPSPKGIGFWTRAIIGIIIILIITLGLYILLQEWYKRKYETYLFKNKNNLYNLLFFIKNAKSKGMKNDAIRVKLKRAKWKNEQIIYALNKFEGKRIGMWEIPLLRPFEKKRIKKELEKRKRVARL